METKSERQDFRYVSRSSKEYRKDWDETFILSFGAHDHQLQLSIELLSNRKRPQNGK